MKLYSYWRSTTSYRVRMALALKGIDYDTVPIDLVAGAQRGSDYVAVNPVKGVPALELADGTILTQSMAILDYLDQVAEPRLLPEAPAARAQVLAAALIMATDVHPVNNLKVVQKLKTMGHEQSECVDWMHHWMVEGLGAFQAMIPQDTKYAFGDTLTLADICLVAQLYNAHRWGVDLAPFARLTRIEKTCLALPAIQAAHPDNQPDAKAAT